MLMKTAWSCAASPGCTGLQVSQLIREKNNGYRPYFGGSPGTSLFVPYQVFTGQNKMAGYLDGMGINCATGMEMILSNGEIIRTGSMAQEGSPAWPHGPGPAMTYLAVFRQSRLRCRNPDGIPLLRYSAGSRFPVGRFQNPARGL